MFAIESWMITFCGVFMFAVFRHEKPPTIPSAAALVKHDDITHGMWSDTKTLFKNFNFVLVLLIFTFIYTVYSGLGFIINPLFIPFGYTTTQISLLAAIFVLVGSISSVAAGIFLDKTKKYLFMVRAIPWIGSLIFLLAIFVIPTGSFGGSLTIVVIGGIVCVPIIAVSFSFGTEVSHPVQPALVIGAMMSCAQLSLFGMNFVFLALLADNPPNHSPEPVMCLLVFEALLFVSGLLSLPVKEDLRRLNAGLKKKELER